jgi:ubiquinone/menaquinone biosynthesis C-methylase UbiE
MLNRQPFSRLISLALFAVLASSDGAVAQRSRAGGSVATERIFDALALKEGSVVAEIGAGDGELSLAAARRVGATGRLYTTELGEERVQKLEGAVKAAELPQITVVAGAAASSNLPDGCCDAIFMRNVYHHLAEPAAMNASLFRALKPGGRIAVVDFTPPPDRGEAARPDDRSKDGSHGVTPASSMPSAKRATAAGSWSSRRSPERVLLQT